MSEEKFDIDDILNEVRTARTKKSGDNGDPLAGIQPKNEAENAAYKPDFSVTDVINSIPSRSAKLYTEEEMNERRNREISEAFDNLDKKKTALKSNAPVSAKQLSEEESEMRIARDVSRAVDVKKLEKLSGMDGEDDVRTYQPLSSNDDNEGIVFHSKDDLVTTDTMQIRRQQKVADINEALLKIDSETDNPDDILDSLNPMESRQKAKQIIKEDIAVSDEDNTDTLAVAGNDLKRIGKGGVEHVKEYKPAMSRRREETPPNPERFTGISKSAVHVGDTIVEALNKKIREQKEQAEKGLHNDSTEPDKIAVTASAKNEEPTFNEREDPAEKIRIANELAQKKKRKIAGFILENTEGDTEELEKSDNESNYADDEYEDDEEAVCLDDEDVIRDRLDRSQTGLRSRLIILTVLFAAALFVALVNQFSINVGALGNIINFKFATNNYLYTHLTIGILSFTACSSVISNGFSRLFKLRPDGDTLCALAHTTAIAALVPYLSAGEFVQRGRSQVYLLISLAALICNTISKLFTVRTAQKNFDFVFDESRAKYFISRCEGSGAEHLAKGAVNGMPNAVSMRKTEMLCDFIVSTYCEDLSDIISRRLVPITLVAAIAGGVAGYFSLTEDTQITMNRVSWAVTVCTAVFAVGASFASSLSVTLPLYFSSHKSKERGSVVLGYQAAAELADTNAVLVEAKTLFPANAVKINNICGYDKPKNRYEGKINIDEAIIFAASLAMASNSVLSDAFFGMLNFKQELLKPVSGCVYENNLGVMGWIDRRRVLLGTRKHMISHEITVPNMKKENAANINNDEVIYLAVGGEVCLLFFVQLTAAPDVRRTVQLLAYNDISIVIKAVDGIIGSDVITDLFKINEDNMKVLPFELHETFNENTKFVPSGSAALACDGTFSALADTIMEARTIKSCSTASGIIQAAGIALGFLLVIIFGLFANYGMLNLIYVFLYNVLFAVLTLLPQFFFKKT